MNTGKQFEVDFKASVPPNAWCYRLKDSAATYYGGNENLSFSIDNICDFLVYRYPMSHLLELKTIETPSIPLEKVFGKYDKAKCKYRKEKHITDMVEAMGYSEHLPINPLYCEGQKRVGCIGCPMAGRGVDSVSLCVGLLIKKCTFLHLKECLMSEKQKVCRATGKLEWTFSVGGWKITTSAVS